MSKINVLNNIVGAGFRERSRKYSFLITIGFIILIAYKYIPPTDANYLTLSLGNIRGVYNSAWIGSALAMITSTILSIPAFYIVKNSIERDTQTGVGQIIAATPMTRLMYTIGKMLSNFAVLAVMVLVIALSGFVMQFIRGEFFTVDILALLMPFVYSTLPTMVMVSALAILFETIPFLRGSFGNFVYFFIWLGFITFYIVVKTQIGFERGIDPLGIGPIVGDMMQTASTIFPDYHGQQLGIGVTPVLNTIRTFTWQGVPWTFKLFAGRMLWVVAAFLITSVSALFFKRFDTTRMAKSKRSSKKNATRIAKSALLPTQRMVSVSSIYGKLNLRSRYARILSGELMLMLKGLSRWWYLVWLIINIFAFIIPIDPVREVVLPLTLLWPLMVWSSLGVREKRNRTRGFVFASSGLMKYQFTAMLLSGVIIAVLSSVGVVIRFAAQGLWMQIIALVVAALFISALALLCGIWSANKKVFEVVYMVIWYIGPLSKFELFDFIGTSGASITNYTYYWFIAALLMVSMAFIGRILKTRQV